MTQKYKLLYYLKRVYVGGFSHWSETADCIIENAHHSLPVGGAFGTWLKAVNHK